MQKDDLFGSIEWNGDEWQAAPAAVPYLEPFGERVLAHLAEADRGQLHPPNTLPLTIAAESRRRPSDGQRAAWTSIRERGDHMWDDVLDALADEYRRQRPARAKYWLATRGDALLGQSLPAEIDRAGMKRLVLPLSCTIEAADDRDQGVAAFVTFLATWFSEAINVYIRRGAVTDRAPLAYFMNRRMPSIATPAFGILRRDDRSPEPWAGEIQLDPFATFAAIAVDRAGWDEGYTSGKGWRSGLPWDVARGEAMLTIYAPTGEQPAATQAAALDAFRQPGSHAAAGVLDALFQHYRQTAPARRDAYRAADRDLAVPPIDEPQGLASVTELKEVTVFPSAAPDRTPVGLIFRGSWTGTDGIGVRWCNGRVEEIGRPRAVARPGRAAGPSR